MAFSAVWNRAKIPIEPVIVVGAAKI